MSPQLSQLADTLLTIKAEPNRNNIHPVTWSSCKVEAMFCAAFATLCPNEPMRYPLRIEPVRNAMANHGFTGTAFLADLMEARLKERGAA